MSDTVLRYAHVETLEDLVEPGTCVVRACRVTASTWRLWFTVLDEIGRDAGVRVLLSVAISPSSTPVDRDANGERAWALDRVAPGTWRVRPSINVPDVWHHTPTLVNVPEPAPWTL